MGAVLTGPCLFTKVAMHMLLTLCTNDSPDCLTIAALLCDGHGVVLSCIVSMGTTSLWPVGMR